MSVPAAIVLAGCSSDSSEQSTPSTPAPSTPATSGGAPITASLTLEAGHSLVGRLVIDAATAVSPTITVTGSERQFEIPVLAAAEHHEIAVVGLRAEHEYTVMVSGDVETWEATLATGPLPDAIPTMLATVVGQSVGSACTLFNVLDITDTLSPGDEPAEPADAGLLVAVDSAGEVVWYHQTPHPIGDVRQLGDGTILHEYNDTGARHINLFGETLSEWAGQIITGPLALDAFGRQVAGDGAIQVATDSMHHELGQLPDGNYVTLSSELLTYTGFDEGLCGETEGFTGSYELITDVVVVFTPDGDIVESYPLSRYLDPLNEARDQNVCGLPFDGVFPNWLYRAQGFANARDWTHANSVVPDPTGEFFTVSVRNLDAILQIERGTGALAWRFGIGGDFAMSDDADFPYHQHALQWQDDGTLLLYDNGNGRPVAAGGSDAELTEPYSRVAQYRLDPEAGEAELMWRAVSTIDDEPVFASFVGDADRLANGNVLVTDGGLNVGRPDGVTAKITELVPTGDGGDIVFELRFAEPGKNLAIYRAERLNSLYPTAIGK